MWIASYESGYKADRFLAGQSVRQITMWLNRDDGPVSPSKGKSRLNV